MPSVIPEAFADLLGREKKAYAHLALVRADGSPTVTPVWFDFDGEHFVLNTARGRLKDNILRKRPRVAFDIPDPSNPYRYVQVRGRVVSESEEGAYDVICDLNEKYNGKREYPRYPGEVRVIYTVVPEAATTMG